ncbi:electron transfer flavoprotein alpha subunit apoprotein [Breoghania corrubedonensis]|uniref:Electron transfer flavoprotein alpha subunit apoprotein n=1 Tax=Breoghania corrubedonensis TaxID=665038 RepID=A0A2T5V7W9_9HYPH|nr:electron transfer flavoprotein subunit alpha/FixB family protein [Breoghania corrubedonensis]PTW59836.1 electron transfer flavoprotein alpha subunit apoprotein [Breoghania corrubedonensis]
MKMRRDPRSEREARRSTGGERPRFSLMVLKPAVGRLRRSPRIVRQAATVSISPRLRIAWNGRVAPQASGAVLAARAPVETMRVVAEPAFHVLVVPDTDGEGGLSEIDRQLIAAGRSLADSGGGAVCALALQGGDDLGGAGADRVIAVTGIEPLAYDPEGRTAAVLTAIAILSPRHVLFAETPDGSDIARRVAARLGERLFAGADALEAGSDGDTRALRRAQGGSLAQSAKLPRLVSIMPDAFPLHAGLPHEGRPLDEVPMGAADRRISASRPLTVDPDTIALEEADFLLSGGNGVTDWQGFADLAEALGATRAGSRVVCDQGHLPRERQVGASGTLVTAGCYFALGISGAPQHLQGITRVGHVVAVNTDLHAEMIKRADLAIVADAQAVMPALIRLLAERKGGGDD